MPVININRTHELSIDELRLKIDEINKKLETRFELRSEWESDRCLLFRRKGLKGSVEIDEKNFQFSLNLSIMYRSMKTQIENEIVSVVDGHLQNDKYTMSNP